MDPRFFENFFCTKGTTLLFFRILGKNLVLGVGGGVYLYAFVDQMDGTIVLSARNLVYILPDFFSPGMKSDFRKGTLTAKTMVI